MRIRQDRGFIVHEEEAISTTINPLSLKMLRETRKLTQEKLAEKAGLSKRVVAACEDPNRDSKPRATTAAKLAKALGVSVAALSEPVDTRPDEENLESTTVRISERAKANFITIGKKYGVTRDEIVEFSPLMFEILAEMSLERRKKQFPKWTKATSSNGDPEWWGNCEGVWLEIALNQLFTKLPYSDSEENLFGEFIRHLTRKWRLDRSIKWDRFAQDDNYLAPSYEEAGEDCITSYSVRIPRGTIKSDFNDWRDKPDAPVSYEIDWDTPA